MNNTGNHQTLRNDLLPQEEFVDLQKYLRMLWLNKLTIAGIGLLCALIGVAALSVVPKRYEATASLSFENSRANLTDIREVVENRPENRDYLQTQVEIIQSRQLIGRVIQKLALTQESMEPSVSPLQTLFNVSNESSEAPQAPQPLQADEFSSEPAAEISGNEENINGEKIVTAEEAISRENNLPLEQGVPPTEPELVEPITVEMEVAETQPEVSQALINRVKRNLIVELVRGTQLIKITYHSYSAEISAEVANTLAEEYLVSQTEAKQEVTSKAADWLSERLDSLRVNLEGSERTLYEFQRLNNLVDLDGVRGLASQELNEVTTQLLEAKRLLQEISTNYKLVQRKKGDVDGLLILPQLQSHPTIQGIRQQQANINRQISDLQLRYGPKHPRMIAAQNELVTLENRLESEINGVAAVIVGQYEAAQASVAGLENEISRVKGEFQAISQQEIEYDELKRQVDINRELYDTFLTRARETTQGTGFDENNARLADPAAAPVSAIDNKFNLIVFGAALFGILLASCCVFLYELLQDSIRNPDDVELQLRQKMFGLIPLVGKKSAAERIRARSYFDRRLFQFGEAIKTLRTSLVLSHLDSPAKIITITSSVPGEGKTTLSTSLAFALSQNERVLLIDADLRRPSVGKEFNLSSRRPGLTNLIAGTHSEKDCVFVDPESGLHVLASGPVPPDAQQILNSLRFSNSVKLLAKKYDRIIIDTAPVNAVSDALMISRLSDSTLYVVKSGSTRKKVIQRGIDRLAQVDIQIDGIILNQVDINSKSARSEEFYGYYGGQYGYGQEAQPAEISGADRRGEILEIA